MRHLKLRILAPIFAVLFASAMAIPAFADTAAPTGPVGTLTEHWGNFAGAYTLVLKVQANAATTIDKVGYFRECNNDNENVTMHVWTSSLSTPAASTTLLSEGTCAVGVQWGAVSVPVASGGTAYIGVEQASGYGNDTLFNIGSVYGHLNILSSWTKTGDTSDISTGLGSGGYWYNVFVGAT